MSPPRDKTLFHQTLDRVIHPLRDELLGPAGFVLFPRRR